MKWNQRTRYMLIGGVIIVGIGIGAWKAKEYLALNQPDVFSSGEPVIVSQLPDQESDPVDAVPYAVEEVVGGLVVPWSIVFTGNERMLVSERNGSIREILSSELQETPLFTFSDIASKDEEGLMGLVLDPDYEENKYLYACYAYPQNGEVFDRVVRLIDQGDQLALDQTIIERIPAAQYHAGCRLGFGPDGYLYITTGDATDRNIAQDITSLGGKILRISSDGSIPDDNPFSNSPVYSYGHRNPQGIDWHPLTDALFETEHGPSVFDGPAGGDEVNIIHSGGNYGWPVVSHNESAEGMNDPLLVFTPAVAPASGMFYEGDVFPQFKNNFFFGGLRGQAIVRVELSDAQPHTVIQYEKLSIGDLGRIREITQGPDGFIYFATSNRDGRGEPKAGDDKIYRIVPE